MNMCKDKMIMIDSVKATTTLLNYPDFSKLSYRDQVDLFFIDYSIIPLLVHDNYLGVMDKTFKNKDEDVNRLAAAASYFSLADTINNQIMGNQNWNLLPELALTHAIAPCHFIKGECQRVSSFPMIFAKMSS